MCVIHYFDNAFNELFVYMEEYENLFVCFCKMLNIANRMLNHFKIPYNYIKLKCLGIQKSKNTDLWRYPSCVDMMAIVHICSKATAVLCCEIVITLQH